MSEIELPPVDETTAPWWDATREHRLLLQHCGYCDAVQHYPRALCTLCGATDRLGWVEANGAGVIDSFTVVYRALPGFDAPYVVARVRLAEGPVVLTNLVGREPQAWHCDEAVQLAWRDLSDGRALPVFASASR
jgi:uncharacterized OB-fold protein